MTIFTIGYTQKTAAKFFELIRTNEIDALIDVRRYNSSQLAGFAKGHDLEYFLSQICDCSYIWATQFAPTASLLDDYQKNRISWKEYEKIYHKLLDGQDLRFFEDYANKRICLLCAENLPERCHRRLLAERVAEIYPSVEVRHL